MITREEVDASPVGMPYLLSGLAKEHIGDLAEAINQLTSGEAPDISDEDFRRLVTNKLEGMDKAMDELAAGMNYLHGIMKRNGMIGGE